MEELKDVSIHHTALKILSEITSMKNYDEAIYKRVQVFGLIFFKQQYLFFNSKFSFFICTEIGLYARSGQSRYEANIGAGNQSEWLGDRNSKHCFSFTESFKQN